MNKKQYLQLIELLAKSKAKTIMEVKETDQIETIIARNAVHQTYNDIFNELVPYLNKILNIHLTRQNFLNAFNPTYTHELFAYRSKS